MLMTGDGLVPEPVPWQFAAPEFLDQWLGV